MESPLCQAGVFVRVETVELRRASRAGGFGFQGSEEVEGEDALPEIAFIEGSAEDGFVEVLELGEGEPFGEQLEADRLPAEFAAEAGEGGVEDGGVVEGEINWNRCAALCLSARR